jgi:hypothetical protein
MPVTMHPLSSQPGETPGAYVWKEVASPNSMHNVLQQGYHALMISLFADQINAFGP